MLEPRQQRNGRWQICARSECGTSTSSPAISNIGHATRKIQALRASYHPSTGAIKLPEHLPARLRAAVESPAPADLPDAPRLEEIERHAILQGLRDHQQNRTETAKALGISRRALTYKLQRFREQGFEV